MTMPTPTMAFVAPLPLPLLRTAAARTAAAAPAHPRHYRARARPRPALRAALDATADEDESTAPTPATPSPAVTASVPASTTATQVYGPNTDVCTFGDECALTAACIDESPALQKLADKYVFPMREENTQVFFDNSIHPSHTLLIVFARDRHGLVLDVVSVLKALSVRAHRVASSESDALRLVMSRIEGDLVSLADLGLSLHNCLALWISDEATATKISDDGARLDQIAQCIKLELVAPYPRPRPRVDAAWHRVCVQKDRAERYTVFTVHTVDRPGLLAQLSGAFDGIGLDVASASIETFATRVENHFFVTKRGFKQPLDMADIELALEHVLRALLIVGDPGPDEILWYQTRDGTALIVAEAIFVDEVNNHELACFRFSEIETPNFRGRLPEAPYMPISKEE